MSEPQLLHFDVRMHSPPQWPEQTYNECLTGHKTGPSGQSSLSLTIYLPECTSYTSIYEDFSIISPKAYIPRRRNAACPGSRSCPLVLGLFVCLAIHTGGKLIRYFEQDQRYVNGETFYRLHVLSLLPNYYANIVHLLLAAALKAGSDTSWVVILCENFTRQLFFPS